MNEQTALRVLQDGYALEGGTKQVQQIVTVEDKGQSLVQITQPTVSSKINTTALAKDTTNVIEFNFTNNTGSAQILYLSALFGTPGSHTDFGLQPSAVDFSNFLETDSLVPNFGGIVKGFNRRAARTPFIIGKLTIQTTDFAQSNNKLIVGSINELNQKSETSKIPNVCDSCSNNNSSAYTKDFRGPFTVGGNAYLGYKINSGISVMIRLELIGIGNVYNFSPASSGQIVM